MTVSEFLVESGVGVVEGSSGGVLGITCELLEEEGILSPFTDCPGSSRNSQQPLDFICLQPCVSVVAGWCHAPGDSPASGASSPRPVRAPASVFSVTSGSPLWLPCSSPHTLSTFTFVLCRVHVASPACLLCSYPWQLGDVRETVARGDRCHSELWFSIMMGLR